MSTSYSHVPVLVLRTDGKWGVICDACSHAAGDYVYPCRDPRMAALDNYWPPAVLVPDPA